MTAALIGLPTGLLIGSAAVGLLLWIELRGHE